MRVTGVGGGALLDERDEEGIEATEQRVGAAGEQTGNNAR
jgi:hypothetical protein